MPDGRISSPAGGLGAILVETGGRTITDMVAEAESRVATLSSAIRAYSAEQVREILDIYRRGEVAMFTESRTVSTLAMNIAETASVAHMTALGEAARGICAMIDALIDDGVWHTEALAAHINSLALLSRPEAPGEKEAAPIIARLAALRAAVGITD